MPNSSSLQPARARRALIEDIKEDKKGWLQHGIAALAVSLLGLGVAGSMVLTGGAAQHATAEANTSVQTTTSRPAAKTSRDSARVALDPARVQSLADQRAEELRKAENEVAKASTGKGAKAREKALKSASAATRKRAALILKRKAAAKSARRGKSSPAPAANSSNPVKSGGRNCLPITRGYSIAARFGQVGPWSRYHTGFDFSAPVGTPLHAPAPGVVINAGSGQASGWAGNYVAIKHADGSQTLMAHMSTVSVRVGQSVGACQLVGAVGMTGRTFGPHVHFEVYPAGVTPGDVYKAVNPLPWLSARGLRP